MQKLWAVILLSALVSTNEALPQTKWSRPVRNSQTELTRERRQFPFGDWIPLTQSCPTCRLFADPLDAGLRGDSIGLTPPRPPTVTRQIHGEGNFFQDESSILSVPPPPPSITSSNGNFQFSFGQQFSNPLPTQKVIPQNQQVQFFPQTFLPNQPLLVNGNQQILNGINGQGNLFQGQGQQQVNGKVTSFQNSEFKSQNLPENVVLEQNKRPLAPKPFTVNKPQPFTAPQPNQQQTFVQQQAFNGQRQQFGGSILTPPPAPGNVSQDIVIPGLDKEEIQLLYVPVETLRQRGSPQEQLLTQQPQNIHFFNRPNSPQRPVNNVRPTEQTLVTQSPKGHFVTQTGNVQGQSESTLKVTSAQPFSTSVTPSSLLLQHLPFQQTPQPFVSATPATPTLQSFVTPASVFQKFSPFTPETTLSHLSTVPNSIQFSQSDVDFGTTPKAISSQGAFQGEIITGKPEFSGIKSAGFSSQEQGRPAQQAVQQSFVSPQQVVTQPPQQNAVFTQEQQKGIIQGQFPTQIDHTQIALQKQQEAQRLLQQQRQKELEEQRFLEQQRKQKELEEQRLIQQQRQKELEQQRFLQKQKELEEQRLLQQQRQKELEQQRLAQKQKELEEQRLIQQRQKELEQQRYLQKQKELEEQRLLQQQQRQKELEQQRFLQQQRQKELEQQRFLQEQRQKELEQQRLLQQLKQKEEEQQRLFRLQQQQKELEQQKLIQAQQEQQRLLQKQANQQKFLLFQQQHKQNAPQQTFQQTNRQVLSDKDNLIPELEKESEDDQQLVPHQPPLSVFFKGYNGAQARITDVLRELRSSNKITVLDQYFEKMPKVFVGPAGLIPPTGYGKFDLPYLSNLESNRIDRRIDKLPFFVAPLNFVPPPGYAKIPFPAPHVGSVVISSETNPAMRQQTSQVSAEEENNSGSYPVVGPELPGLINNLDTTTTTAKPYVSTPSLPQTTAQLRNRRPNSSLYKPQSRKPITRTRSSTTSRPEEEVTQPIQKTEVTESVRKPFNRFLHRRRQQTKTTTESSLKGQQDGKNLENRYYSVEVYHQEKNQVPQQNEDQVNRQFEHSSIDRITPGHGVFEVSPTPDYSLTQQVGEASGSEERQQDTSDYSDVSLQTFEDGPLPTGSAKTITQELYRPNAINQQQGEINYKQASKSDSTADKFVPGAYEDVTTKSPDAVASVSEEHVSVPPTPVLAPERQSSYESTEAPNSGVSFSPVTSSGEYQTKGFGSDEQYTSAFAEISKHHHIPGTRDQSNFRNVYPTPQISVDLQAPFSKEISGEVRPTGTAAGFSDEKVLPTGSSGESYLTGYESVQNQQSGIPSSQASPTASTDNQYISGVSVNSEVQQNPVNANRNSGDDRTASFISFHGVSSAENSQQYYPSSTAHPVATESTPIIVEQSQFSSTPESVAEVTVNPSVQTYTAKSEFIQDNDQTQISQGQDIADNSGGDQRLNLPNPSIVRVRTRVRGKSRGQVNFANSQSTTTAPYTRSASDSRQQENSDQDSKTNSFREYQASKTSKYNSFRGLKKPVRTTTEPATEPEHKSNVYTIRPPRRPLSPSTVSTKRIRRPTTPIPSAEAVTEVFSNSDISPSGVSNDVYYEQSSLSPVKNKFRKHFSSAEQKNDFVPVYTATATPFPTYSTADGYSEESNVVRDVAYTESPLETSDRYPEWNPSESGFDVSGIVLTTEGTQEEPEVEEPKKAQDSKKAFDPDLEKKTGRRRVRVRVHKRPHENFETAESQNLRTVANVLVPPTTTYKPSDESGIHQLAKNADFSFGGQKLFGVRSREYFRKRLNLTEGELPGGEGSAAGETGTKSFGVLKKSHKTGIGSTSAESNDSDEGNKAIRPKFRGFVRKIVKHGGAGKEKESEGSQQGETEESERRRGNGELRQQIRFNQGFNHTGRVNGTKHKTFVRFVKKNKVRPHETELEDVQKEEEEVSQTEGPVGEAQQTSTAESQQESQQPQEEVQVQQEEEEVKQSQRPSAVTTESVSEETPEPSSTPQGRPKFFQTLRPVYQRTSQSFYRTRETEAPSSTTQQTIQEPQEKRFGHSRPKYGKLGASATEKTEENKKVSEQQLKNKNLHTLEVRKYLRTKNREGAFSQFSRNRYFTSEKTESETTKHEESSESEEVTTEIAETTSIEPKTTQFARTENLEIEGETTKIENEQPTTTEAIASEETSAEQEETTTSGLESTTESEVLTTVYKAANTEAPVQVSSTEAPATETQPDIYRFSKNSFSFETEKFTGTKNRAHVRNITTDIIENTASFSAPGVEKRPEIRVVTQRGDEILPAATETLEQKTEETTTETIPETTTEYPETETTAAAEAITKAKLAKILKTSTTTKVSHETEICYRGKCIRTKNENPDEDLKLLVDSASTMKIQKRKT